MSRVPAQHGSAFGACHVTYDRVEVIGSSDEYTRISDDGGRAAFSFCPECGAIVYYKIAAAPEVVAVPVVGAFADPPPRPQLSSGRSASTPGVSMPPELERHH